MSDEHDRFVTIPYFAKMLGVHRGWYYRHMHDPGMPKRVLVGSKIMLSLAACAAFVERLKRHNEVPVPQKKRGPGRPRKLPVMGNHPVRRPSA
jgi:predicted DNA-binding transcriptional regulator AlpA